MSKRWLFSLLLLIPAVASAQRCAGRIHFIVRDSPAAGGTMRPIVFGIDPAGPYMDRARGTSGEYEIFARVLVKGKEREPLPSLTRLAGEEFMVMRYGCLGNYELLVVRHFDGRFPPDSMAIRFMNACDETFAMYIDYRPGEYSVLVCDRTKIPVDNPASLSGYVYRPLEEQHPGKLFFGFDITHGLKEVRKE